MEAYVLVSPVIEETVPLVTFDQVICCSHGIGGKRECCGSDKGELKCSHSEKNVGGGGRESVRLNDEKDGRENKVVFLRAAPGWQRQRPRARYLYLYLESLHLAQPPQPFRTGGGAKSIQGPSSITKLRLRRICANRSTHVSHSIFAASRDRACCSLQLFADND